MKVDYIDHMGTDLTAVNAARVSHDKRHETFHGTDEPLTKRLARHDHWSPFAHSIVTLRITVPIFVSNQLKRHQIGFALNEVSRRYVKTPPEYEHLVWRRKPPENIKQGSGRPLTEEEAIDVQNRYLEAMEDADASYEALLEMDVAPEQARSLLPQSMHTSFYWTGSLYAWARLCGQRLDPHAQGETQAVAREVDKIIAPLFPVGWPVLLEAFRVRGAAYELRDLLQALHDASRKHSSDGQRVHFSGSVPKEVWDAVEAVLAKVGKPK